MLKFQVQEVPIIILKQMMVGVFGTSGTRTGNSEFRILNPNIGLSLKRHKMVTIMVLIFASSYRVCNPKIEICMF